MRNAFADELTTLAATDSSITLLSGDIGNRLFDPFKAATQGRFFNCGIAEGNMMGVAAGMALSGLRPVVYTIAPFATYRCYEQIRIDACYHHLPVVIVGAGAGLTYAELGPTHHSCEDLAIMRVLPNMTVIAPSDANGLRYALRAALHLTGPSYIRIGKKGESTIARSDEPFEIGRSITVCAGNDVCLIATGTILAITLQAAGMLNEHAISTQVEEFHTVKPLDTSSLAKIFNRYAIVAVIEEHSRIGGLGGSIAEWLATQSRVKGQLLTFGTDDAFMHAVGSQGYARSCYGLTATNIVSKIMKRL